MVKVLPVLLAVIGIASGVSDPDENNPNYKNETKFCTHIIKITYTLLLKDITLNRL